MSEEKKWDHYSTPKLNFRFTGEDENGTFRTNIKVFDGGMESFAHKARIVTPEFTDFEIEAHENVEEKRLPVTSNGELGSLSQSFNRLLDRLQREKLKKEPK